MEGGAGVPVPGRDHPALWGGEDFQGLLQGRVVAVAGAAGYFGPYLLDRLLCHGVRRVHALDLKRGEEFGLLMARAQEQVVFHEVDVVAGPAEEIRAALRGAEVVVNCVGILGSLLGSRACPDEEKALVMAVNAEGTKAVLQAAAAEGIRAFIHLSTVNVIFSGLGEVLGVDESTPYVAEGSFMETYGASKCVAEKAVLAANGRSMATACLRPNGLWGPTGDAGYAVATMLQMHAACGFVCYIISSLGGAEQATDWTHCSNLAEAVVLTAAALLEGKAGVAGEVFNITDGVVATHTDFQAHFYQAAGLSFCPLLTIPGSLVVSAGRWLEAAYAFLRVDLRLPWVPYPFFNEFMARKATTTHYVSIEKAKSVLGYRPLPVGPLMQEVCDHLESGWRRRHAVPAAGLLPWLVIPLAMGQLALLALLRPERHSWRLPWEATRALLTLGDPTGTLAHLPLEEFRSSVLLKGFFIPACVVHLADGCLAAALARSAGSMGWPVWGFKTTILGYAQLRHHPGLRWYHKLTVLAWTVGAFAAAPAAAFFRGRARASVEL